MSNRLRRGALSLLLALLALGIMGFPAAAHEAPRRVTAVAQQGDAIWLGSTEGLWRLAGQQLTPVELPFLDPHVTALYSDGETLWVGTFSAIGAQRPQTGWQVWERGTEGLGSAWARGFTRWRGEVVVGTYDRGAYRRAGQQWEAIPGSPLAITALASAGDVLHAQSADGTRYEYDGAQWRATAGGNVLPPTLPALPGLPVTRMEKPPVVLVHGLGDSNQLGRSNMRFLAQWLKRDGYPVYYVAYNETTSAVENSVRVADTVARAAAGGRKPILIAHSYGGLLARTFLALHPDTAAGLVTLGTPNAGLRLAYDVVVPDLADDPNPQWRELLPEHTDLLEPYWMNDALPQLHIGGNILPRENFFEGFPPYDGIVDAASALAAPGATRLYPLLHGWTFATMRYGLDGYLYPKDLYDTTIRPFLAALESNPPTNRATAPPLGAPGFTQTALFDGQLAAGESVNVNVAIENPPATWILDGTGVEMTLTDPAGRQYAGERTGVGFAVSHLPYRDNVLQPLDLWSTEAAGVWQVGLTNREARTVEARLSVIQPDQPALNVTVETPWVLPGETVMLTATGAAGQALQAFVGDTSTPFGEVAPGNYRATIAAPTEPGYHAVRVSNGSVERWTVLTVRSAAFTVGNAEITARDGVTTLQLPVTGNGDVVLGAQLYDGEDRIAVRLSAFKIVGQQIITIEIPAEVAQARARVLWELFDANGALIPVTPPLP